MKLFRRSFLASLVLAALAWFTGTAAAQPGPILKPARPDLINPLPDFTLSPKVARPKQHALIVLLENGGISSSLKAVLKQDLPKIPVAKCGNFKFEMKKNESIPQLIQRVFNQIAAHPECLIPTNWSIVMVPAEGLLDPITNYFAVEIAKFAIKAQGASSKYDKVVILQNGNFTAPKVIEEIKKLAPKYVLDIHVLSHGSTNLIVGFNDAKLNPKTFFKPLMALKAEKKLNLFLRTVYQMNCLSGTLVKEWSDLGAEAVCGTDGAKMNFVPNGYVHFLGRWLNNQTFKQAVTGGYNDGKTFLAPLYAALGHPEYITVSELFVTGKGNLKVTSP